jgi:DNA modification methylase
MKYKLLKGDCLELVHKMDHRVKCIFADPPDNIGLDYKTLDDRKSRDEYLGVFNEWIEAFCLKADIVWFSFNAKWTAEVGEMVMDTIRDFKQHHDITLEYKPCVQVFTFGQHNKNDFGNNHRPLWRIMRKGAKLYPEHVKVQSWRQRNGDKRAAPGGRVPGDVLDFQYPTPREDTIASPEKHLGRVAEHMIHPGDVLDFPRVTGNSAQRCDWHPTQLHEELVERVIRLSTTGTDVTLDPFGGTGTTMRVCKKLGQACTLMEMDDFYCQQIAKANGLKVLRLAGGGWGSDK